ncbi:ST3 beta-galactoside alpha-2,3-sialyltransferase 1 [Pycnococcus provasolii]|uniref:ST3 beta-galactoside alpha-2,3-sialyltransferase 1 n=1 Tax=Pycnococcus provasolii TaxID=41880 RepID=A0A830HUS8_9CHLO|nr:ST3 beta-galactoside alpha-2,3-sialyltransferase 1 [Pycnococcus provasolii]
MHAPRSHAHGAGSRTQPASQQHLKGARLGVIAVLALATVSLVGMLAGSAHHARGIAYEKSYLKWKHRTNKAALGNTLRNNLQAQGRKGATGLAENDNALQTAMPTTSTTTSRLQAVRAQTAAAQRAELLDALRNAYAPAPRLQTTKAPRFRQRTQVQLINMGALTRRGTNVVSHGLIAMAPPARRAARGAATALVSSAAASSAAAAQSSPRHGVGSAASAPATQLSTPTFTAKVLQGYAGAYVLSHTKWNVGDVLKVPKVLTAEGRARRAARGKVERSTKTLKWDHAGALPPLFESCGALPKDDPVRMLVSRRANGGQEGADRPWLDSCAVVGNGGGLAIKRHGAEIDAHTAILRFNGGPVHGFEAKVGSRTTWRLTNSEHFAFHDDGVMDEGGACLQHVTSGVGLDLMQGMCRARAKAPSGVRDALPLVFVIDPEFHYFAMNVMSGAGVAGAPSNGFYGLLFASSVCRRISVYGFQKNWKDSSPGSKRVPYHYYDTVEPNESQFRRDTGEAGVFHAYVDAANAFARKDSSWRSWSDQAGWTGDRITLY